MKMCGILDELGNKLCIPKTKDCPINYIKVSNNSPDEKYNYNFSDFGNKRIYYTNEAVSGKIIGGLYVDSDLLIQYKDEECEILDTGSISELINDNKILYKNVLDFDPYSENNIDNKGKSYLKWCIVGQGRNRDLNTMKKENITFSFNKTINKDSIKPIKDKIKDNFVFPILGFVFIVIYFIIFLFIFFKINEIGYDLCCCTNELGLFVILFFSFIIFLGLAVFFNIFTAINSLAYNDYLIQMKETNLNFLDSLISLNRSYFWINLIMYIIFIIFVVYLYISAENYNIIDFNTKKNQTGNSDFPDFDINNNTSTNTQNYNSNNNCPNDNTNYNNKNSNHSEVGYNSSDYNYN